MENASGGIKRIIGFRANGSDPTPLYLQLANVLRQLIEEGAMREGEALPSERRIMEQTSLSRVTIRKALDLLVKEGLLRQKRGSGTFVAGGLPQIEQPLTRLSSFTEEMIDRGRTPSVQWLEKKLAYPTSEEVMLFGLSPGDKVLHLHRLRSGDGVPLAVEFATVPARYLPDPELVDHSLYAALSAVSAMPVRATQRLKARALPRREADLLGVTAGDPALYIERASRLSDGTLVEFTRSYYRSDTYDFVSELSIAPAEVV
ncbi:GntR family transcriptional regulator [Mariluticola halotolerans]|uniref:GntR family transcriptional regulator n=1 Tax=Mariluticola halotolerans TaxID=2909283 RepID=UPI0026E25FB2|nr:GntR family transcriptional regulator [Mariluticola halotolerans]UJQ95546.1 GntR family transcriptional regulator [Mariluticola halotolerans]